MDGGAILVVILFFLAITLGPPLLFLILGIKNRKRNKQKAKVFFILATVWVIIGGGICASMMMG